MTWQPPDSDKLTANDTGPTKPDSAPAGGGWTPPASDQLGSTATGLSPLAAPTEPNTQRGGITVPKPIKAVAQALYTPIRGTRAIGVGIEKLLAGVNPTSLLVPGATLTPQDIAKIIANGNDALQASARAAQPGYVPAPGEKAGAFLGETGGMAALTAPLAAAGAEAAPAVSEALGIAPEATGAGAQLGRAAVQGAIDAPQAAALTGLQEASETGKIKPMDVAANAAIAAGLPFIKPGFDAIRGATKQVLPEVLQKTAKVPAKATQTLMDDPDLMISHTGTDQAIEQRVGDVQQRLVQMRKGAADALNSVKQDLGIKVPLDQEIENMAQNGPTNMSPQEVAQAFLKAKDIPEQARLQYLVEVRQQADNLVKFSQSRVKPISSTEEGLMQQIAKKSNDQISTLPGGQKLRDAEGAFSKVAGIYDDLQNKLAEPGQAADAMAKIFRGDLNGITNFRSRDVQAALATLDEGQDKKVLEPLWKEMTAKYFNQYIGRGVGSYATGQTGAAAAGFLASHGHPAGLLALPVTASLVSPKLAGAEIRGAAKLSPFVQKFVDSIDNPKLRSAIISSVVSGKGQK